MRNYQAIEPVLFKNAQDNMRRHKQKGQIEPVFPLTHIQNKSAIRKTTHLNSGR